MTTIPDPGLECDLLKKLINTSDQSTEDLIQSVYDWLGKRLQYPDPGFGHLGPVIENFCNHLHLSQDQHQALQTKLDLSMKMLPGNIQEVERIYKIMLSRHADSNDPDRAQKEAKLVEWKDSRINGLKSACEDAQHEVNTLTTDIRDTIKEMIEHVRSHSDDTVQIEDDENVDPALLAEVENMFRDTPTDWDKLARLPTLQLGETVPEPSMELGEAAVGTGGGQDIPMPEILPDNQEGDPSLFPRDDTQPVDSGAPPAEPSTIKRLIVPPGCEVPIKQSMVDIFAKTRVTPNDTTGIAGGGGLDESGVAAGGSEQPAISDQDAGKENKSGDDGQKGRDTPEPKPAEPLPKEDLPTTAVDGTMATSTCEEQALKLIAKLDDGPTKQALMSLCEASLVKVGLISGIIHMHNKVISRLHHGISFPSIPCLLLT